MISPIIFIAVVGVILYLVPIEARYKQLIYVVVVITVIAWLLSITGLWPAGARVFPR